MSRVLADVRGSSTAEFLLVSVLLTTLTLAVLQLAFAVYVRNVVHDAAVDGAYHAALADSDPEAGAERARKAIEQTIGPAYAQDIVAGYAEEDGVARVVVTVRAPLPLVAFVGIPGGLEVSAGAPVESLG